MSYTAPTQTERTIVEKVADHARARHGHYGPKLGCDGLTPVTSADDQDVHCQECGLVLFRGGERDG